MYYGEEIGMIDVPIPPDEIVDPPARRAGPDFPWWNRDQCRTPMPWTAGAGAGFTIGQPWLRIGADAATRNVAAELADPDSVLATYQRLLAVRRDRDALRCGSYRRVALVGDDVFGFTRSTGTDEVLVIVNFSTFDRRADWSGDNAASGAWRSIVGTHRRPNESREPGAIELRPLEGVVLGRS
jgi:alpha-glucosidase